MTNRFRPLGGAIIAATAALATSSVASATSPASLWSGVERIAVRCGGGDQLSDAERARFCEAVVAAIRGQSAYPVVEADRNYVPDILGDLVVSVTAARPVAGKVVLSLQPTRMGNGLGASRSLAPSVVTIDAGARGAQLTQAVAGALSQIFQTPPERRRQVPSPKRAS